MEDKLFYFQPTNLPSYWSNLKKTASNRPNVSIVKNTPESDQIVLNNIHKLYITLIGGGGSGSLGELRPVNHTQIYARDQMRNGKKESEAFDEMTNMLPLPGCGGGAGATVFRLPILLIQKNLTTVSYNVGKGGTGMTVNKDGNGQFIDPVTLGKTGSVAFFDDKEFRRGKNGTDSSVVITQRIGGSSGPITKTISLKAMGGGGGGVVGYFKTRKDIYNMKSTDVQYNWAWSWGAEHPIDWSPSDENLIYASSLKSDGTREWHHYWNQRNSTDPSDSQYNEKTHFNYLAEHYTRIFRRPSYSLIAIHRELDYFIGSSTPSDTAENRNEYIPYNLLTHGEDGIMQMELLKPSDAITLGGVTKYAGNPLKNNPSVFPVPNTPGLKELETSDDPRSFNFIHQYAPDQFYTDDRGWVGIFGYQIQSLRNHPRYYMNFGWKYFCKDRSINYPNDSSLPRDSEGTNKLIIVADDISGDIVLEKWKPDFQLLMQEYEGPLIPTPQRKGIIGAFGGAGGGFLHFEDSTPNTLDGLYGGQAIVNPWGLPSSGKGGNPYPRMPQSIVSSSNLGGAAYYYGGKGYEDANSSGGDVYFTTYFIPGSGGGAVEFVHTSHRLSKRKYQGETVDFTNCLPSFSESTYTSYNESVYDWFVNNYESISTGGKVIYRLRTTNDPVSRIYFNDEFGKHKISYKDRSVKDLLKIFGAGGGGGKAFIYTPGHGQENPEMPPSFADTGCGSGGSCSLNVDGEGVIAGLPYGSVDYYLRRMIEYDEAQIYVTLHIALFAFIIGFFIYIFGLLCWITGAIQIATLILTGGTANAGAIGANLAATLMSKITTSVPKLGTAITTIINIFKTFSEIFKGMLNAVKALFKSIGKAIRAWLKGFKIFSKVIIPTIKQIAKDAIKLSFEISKTLSKIAASKFGKVMKFIGKGIVKIFQLFTGDFMGFLGVEKALEKVGKNMAKSIISGMIKSAGFVDDIKDAIKIVDNVFDTVKAAKKAEKLAEAAKSLKKFAKLLDLGDKGDDFLKIAKEADNFVKNPGKLADLLKDPDSFQKYLDNLKSFTASEKTFLLDNMIKQIDPPPLSATDNLASKVDDFVPSASTLSPPSTVVDDFAKLSDDVVKPINNAGDNLTKGLKGTSDEIAKSASKVPIDDAKNILNKFKESFKSQADALKNIASGNPKQMTEGINVLASTGKLQDLPEAFRSQLAEFFQNSLDDISEEATKWVDDVAENVPNPALINSGDDTLDLIKKANSKIADAQDQIKALTSLQSSLAKNSGVMDDIATTINSLADANTTMQRSLKRLNKFSDAMGSIAKESSEFTSKLLNQTDEIFGTMDNMLKEFPELDALMNIKPKNKVYEFFRTIGKKAGVADNTSYSSAYLSIKASSGDSDVITKVMSSANLKNSFVEKLTLGDFASIKFAQGNLDPKTLQEFGDLLKNSDVLKKAISENPSVLKNLNSLTEVIPDIKLSSLDNAMDDVADLSKIKEAGDLKLKSLKPGSDDYLKLKNQINSELENAKAVNSKKIQRILENVDPEDVRALRNNLLNLNGADNSKLAGRKFFNGSFDYLGSLDSSKDFLKQIDEAGNVKIYIMNVGGEPSDITNLIKEMVDTKKAFLDAGGKIDNLAPEAVKLDNVLLIMTEPQATPELLNQFRSQIDELFNADKSLLSDLGKSTGDPIQDRLNRYILQNADPNDVAKIDDQLFDKRLLEELNDPNTREQARKAIEERIQNLQKTKEKMLSKLDAEIYSFKNQMSLGADINPNTITTQQISERIFDSEILTKSEYGAKYGDTASYEFFIKYKDEVNDFRDKLQIYRNLSEVRYPNPIDNQLSKANKLISDFNQIAPISNAKKVTSNIDNKVFKYSAGQFAENGVKSVSPEDLQKVYVNQSSLDNVTTQVDLAKKDVNDTITKLKKEIAEIESTPFESSKNLDDVNKQIENNKNAITEQQKILNDLEGEIQEAHKKYSKEINDLKFTDPELTKKASLTLDQYKAALKQEGGFKGKIQAFRSMSDAKIYYAANGRFFGSNYKGMIDKFRNSSKKLSKLTEESMELSAKLTKKSADNLIDLTEHTRKIRLSVNKLEEQIKLLSKNGKMLDEISLELSKIKINTKPVAPDIIISTSNANKLLASDTHKFTLWAKEFTIPPGIHPLPLSKDVVVSAFKSVYNNIPMMAKDIGKSTYTTLRRMNENYGTNEFTKGIDMSYKDGNKVEQIQAGILLDRDTTEENFTEKIALDILSSLPQQITSNRLDAYTEIYYNTFGSPIKIEKKEVDNKLVEVLVSRKNRNIQIDLNYAQKYIEFENLNINNKFYYKYLFQNYTDMKNILVQQINIINKNMILVN